ncbi:hypothetical protein GEMRC1_003185 [Eukaryota sp. GEM-RC1]
MSTFSSLKPQFESFFDDFWVSLVDATVEEIHVSPSVRSEIRTHVEELLAYNLKNGKFLRGICVVETAKQLFQSRSSVFSENDLQLASYLGWSVEILQAAFLVADDVMDNSDIRRGQPAWHKRRGVGLAAVNDAFLLESLAYKALDIFFQDHPKKHQMCDLIRFVSRVTEWGQFLDTLGTQVPVEAMEPDLHSAICTYKTSFYTFFLPVSLGLLYCNVDISAELSSSISSLTKLVGHLFQVQDDYLDVFGDEEVVGKPSTDLIERKCAWPLVFALNKSSKSGGEVYGKLVSAVESGDVSEVKSIIHELDIKSHFKEAESQLLTEIYGIMQQKSDSVELCCVSEVLKRIVDYLIGRRK